jgi:ribosomal protein S18 acetylase RimI-like enzyme
MASPGMEPSMDLWKSGNAPDESVAYTTRALVASDLREAGDLLDSTLGPGFWGLELEQPGSHREAVLDGAIVGVASACLFDALPDASDLESPVALVRFVAVAPAVRARGVASRLVREVCEECKRGGAADIAAYAWVHALAGAAPLAGVLERLGFVRERRIEGFYASDATEPCPACGRTPCACPADFYVRRRGAPVADL